MEYTIVIVQNGEQFVQGIVRAHNGKPVLKYTDILENALRFRHREDAVRLLQVVFDGGSTEYKRFFDFEWVRVQPPEPRPPLPPLVEVGPRETL